MSRNFGITPFKSRSNSNDPSASPIEKLAIDAGRMMTQLVGDTSRFEYALAAATVLADVATRSGDHVALMGIGSGLNVTMMSVTW